MLVVVIANITNMNTWTNVISARIETSISSRWAFLEDKTKPKPTKKKMNKKICKVNLRCQHVLACDEWWQAMELC
jgi:hypothetical protein